MGAIRRGETPSSQNGVTYVRMSASQWRTRKQKSTVRRLLRDRERGRNRRASRYASLFAHPRQRKPRPGLSVVNSPKMASAVLDPSGNLCVVVLARPEGVIVRRTVKGKTVKTCFEKVYRV